MYQNKRTRKLVKIKQTRDGIIQVVYEGSGTETWFTKEDFERTFKPVPN